jgi:hypothetical protein
MLTLWGEGRIRSPNVEAGKMYQQLALASGHGRYITVTPERTLFSVGKWPLHIAVKKI